MHRVFAEFQRCEVAESLLVHRSGLSGEGEQVAAAAKQIADVPLKGSAFGAVAPVTRAGRANAGAALFGARAGALAAMHAAAAVAQRAGALTLHRVFRRR